MTTSNLLKTKEVAAMTGVPEGTLRYWRASDFGPPSFTLGPRRVVYRRDAVEAWIAAQEATSTRGGAA